MKDTMRHLIIALAAILFATTGYAATSNHTEGDRVVVTRSVTVGLHSLCRETWQTSECTSYRDAPV